VAANSASLRIRRFLARFDRKRDLSVEIHPNGAVFRVQDTGPGVRPQDRERVFDPFHRVLGSDEYGSGLGLSIVDRLGAGISLGEAPGGGLDVTVTIPRALIRNASPDRNAADARGAAGERPKAP
jgi:signal transduction histidine kinase